MLEKLALVKQGILLTKRGLLLTTIFSFVFYTSYFIFFLYVPRYFITSAETLLVIQALFNFIITFTLIVTSFFINRINKIHAIYAYSIATVISAALLLFSPISILRIVFIFIIAIFFSIGQLAFLTYFWELTTSEERGRVAGLSGFFSLLVYLVIYASVAGALDFYSSVFYGFVVSLGPLLVIFIKPGRARLTAKKDKHGYYAEKRTVLLYVIPWLIFSLINATLAKNISFHISQQVSSSLYLFLSVLQGIGTIFGALIGGLTADFFGRRASLVFSLTLYGVSSALAGIANYSLLYFVYFANGFSWGILLAMYTFVIWGDLSNKANCAKMYAIGFTIFYLTQGLGLLPLEQILPIPLAISSLGSCLLIFLSNIPIFLAPELLSSSFREKLTLRMHIDAAKKIRRSRSQG